MGNPPSVVRVVPNTIWPEATKATIENVKDDSTIAEDVPIERVIYTTATLKVWKSDDPNGVVFLNELTPPENNSPEDMPLISSPGDVIEGIVVSRGEVWPEGIVALFWPVGES